MTAFTISFWAYPLNDNPHFFFVYVPDGTNFIAWRSNKHEAQLAIGSEIQPIGNATFTLPNEWTLVTITWESVNGTAKVYINGELIYALTNFKKGKVFAANGNAAYITLGLPFTAPGNPTPLPLNSRMTEVNVWSQQLSASEIRNIFFCTHTNSSDVAKWHGSVWSLQSGGSVVETTLSACTVAVVDYLRLILDLSLAIFFEVVGRGDTLLTPISNFLNIFGLGDLLDTIINGVDDDLMETAEGLVKSIDEIPTMIEGLYEDRRF